MFNSEILSAYAKINLALVVGDKVPPKNFHRLESLFVRLTLNDKIVINTNFSENVENKVSISCKLDSRLEDHILACGNSVSEISRKIESEEGIIFRTCEKVLKFLNGDYPNMGLDISVLKSIPLEAGLGGGSADAASILNFFSKHLSLPLEIRLQIAEDMGFDVGPCLYHGPSYARFDGQHSFTPLLHSKYFSRRYSVILKPPVGSNTAKAYQALNRKISELANNTEKGFGKEAAEVLLEKVMCGSKEDKLGLVQNDFQANIFNEVPHLEHTLANLNLFNPVLSGLSGSGSSIFSVFTDYKTAHKAHQAHIELSKKGWFLAITEILSL